MKKTTLFPALVYIVSIAFGSVAYGADTFPMQTASVVPSVTQVNLNTADATQIEGKVKGIGQKRAEAIVAYRTQHGAFKSIEDLGQVKGIGESFVTGHLDALQKAFTL